MTREEARRKPREAEDDSIDLSMLRERLSWTPTQRLERHQSALELVMELRKAGAKAWAKRTSEGASKELGDDHKDPLEP